MPFVQIVFGKFGNALTGHEANVRISHACLDVDYEVELAMVMGRSAYRVKEAHWSTC